VWGCVPEGSAYNGLIWSLYKPSSSHLDNGLVKRYGSPKPPSPRQEHASQPSGTIASSLIAEPPPHAELPEDLTASNLGPCAAKTAEYRRRFWSHK